jgi:hypothetical protein
MNRIGDLCILAKALFGEVVSAAIWVIRGLKVRQGSLKRL